MVEMKTIQDYCDLIAREFKPKKIILFGSYAYGKPTPDSDVDLMVILPFKGRGFRKAAEIRQRFHAPFPMDLLARTPREFKKRLKLGDFFIMELAENGKVLYEAAHAGVDRKNRERFHRSPARA